MRTRHFIRINGKSYTMHDAVVFYRRAGRTVRRWHKFMRGWVQGKLVTICLHIASAVEIAQNVASETIAVLAGTDDAISRQRILMDATILGGV